MKRIPVIDVNTGKVIKNLQKMKELKTVFCIALTFFEYEELEHFLDKKTEARKLDTMTRFSTRWQGETYQWKNVKISLEGNSMFLGGNMEVKAPSVEEWKDFLNTHLMFKSKLAGIRRKGDLEYNPDTEKWYREGD